jgi:hypothetical protein
MEPFLPQEPPSPTPEGPPPSTPPPAPLYPMPPSTPGDGASDQPPAVPGYPPSAPLYPGMPSYPPQMAPPAMTPYPPSGQPLYGSYPTTPYGYPPPMLPDNRSLPVAPKPVRGPQIAIILSALVIFALAGVLVITTTLQNRAEVAAHATATAQTQNDQATQVAFAATGTSSAQDAQATQAAFAATATEQVAESDATATMQALEQGYSTNSPGCTNDGGAWSKGSYATVTCPPSGGLRMADTSPTYFATEMYTGDNSYFPRNYQVSLSFDGSSLANNQQVALLLRFSSATHIPSVGIFINTNGSWVLDTFALNSDGSYSGTAINSGTFSPQGTNTLGFVADGTTLSFSANGATLISLPDRNVGTVNEVSIALNIGSGSVLFTNFSLTPIL